jgi:hypothetical protein
MTGCNTWTPDQSLIVAVNNGEYDEARAALAARIEGNDGEQDDSRANRNFVLDRVRYGMIDLADGQYEAAGSPFLAAYDILRAQGVNDDNTINTFLGTEEGQRYWKGDPFEQAAAYAYLAAHLATVNDWDNVNAAAENSLFLLRDFGDIEGEQKEMEDIYRAAEEAQTAEDDESGFEEYIDSGYQPVETNFAPGYFMAGVGNWARGNLGPDYENRARDNFRRAVQYSAALEPVIEAITTGRANTVLWVDAGKGPEKYRTGYREVFSEFRAIDASSNEPLRVRVGGSEPMQVGIGADYNGYATDHRWRSNEELRLTKAIIGDALILSGAAVTSQADDWGQALVGLGMIIGGYVTVENAKADIRHNEVLPQRTYFAAINVENPGTSLELQIAGKPGTRLVLPDLAPPDERERLQFKYIRLNRSASPPAWATSGRVYWANEHSGPVSGADRPYILGGTCVRPPSQSVLDEYHAAGQLLDLSLVDLENLYFDEGLTWELSEQGGVSRRHVLEGGTSLIAPEPGSAGYARLFCTPNHPAYVPRSESLRQRLASAESETGSAAATN